MGTLLSSLRLGAPSVALKAMMAVTGLGMAVWLTLHMLGNLTVFGGPVLMNGYALKLRATGMLWPVRLGLLVCVLVHAMAAIAVSKRSREARPMAYRRLRPRASGLASRSMRWSGAVLLAYLGYHVPHMYGAGHASFVPGDVHHNLVTALADPVHVTLNLAVVALLSLHLAHGLGSALCSLGWVAPRQERRTAVCMRAWAFAVTAGFALPPLGVWLGMV